MKNTHLINNLRLFVGVEKELIANDKKPLNSPEYLKGFIGGLECLLEQVKEYYKLNTVETAYNQTVSMEGEGSEKGIAFTLVEQDNGSEWVFFDSVLNKTPTQAVQDYLDERDMKDEIVYNPEYDTFEVEGIIRACTMYIQI